MKPSKVATQWLQDHGHSLEELDSLIEMIDTIRYHHGWVGEEPEYDPSFGDERRCKCGHPYYRHFDTYEDMSPVGCKYCHGGGDDYSEGSCAGFEEAITLPAVTIRADAQPQRCDCGACKSCMGM